MLSWRLIKNLALSLTSAALAVSAQAIKRRLLLSKILNGQLFPALLAHFELEHVAHFILRRNAPWVFEEELHRLSKLLVTSIHKISLAFRRLLNST